MNYRLMQLYLAAVDIDKAVAELGRIGRKARRDSSIGDSDEALNALKAYECATREWEKWNGTERQNNS